MTSVLVVDDCMTDRRRAAGLLTNAGFEIVAAGNGREALERLARQRPDAVVTDLQMPEIDGLALVTAISRDYPFVPVVVITSQGSEASAVQALQAGAASYVPKRDLGSQLVDTIRRVCLAAGEDRDFARLSDRVVFQEIRHELETDLSLIPPAVRFVRELLNQSRWINGSTALRTAISFEEALLNAFYHGNLEVSSALRDEDPNTYYSLAKDRCEQPPYRDRLVRVNIVTKPDEVRFRIGDEGPGFDPAALPDPTDPDQLDRSSGRGLLLIKTFMDEVMHSMDGSEITMVKRLAPCPRPEKPLGTPEPRHVL